MRKEQIIKKNAQGIAFLTFLGIISIIFIYFGIHNIITFLKGTLKLKFLIMNVVSIIFLLAISIIFYFRLISTDSLCKIVNYRKFNFELEKLHKRNQLKNYTCFFINIKDFKYVNKQITKAGGDEVLYGFAQKLKEFTKGKELPCRVGGDNFPTLIKTERVQEFIDFLNDVIVEIQFEGEKMVFHLKSRAGIFTADESTLPKDILDNSSLSLRSARENKVNFTYYKLEMKNKSTREKLLKSTFPQAIKNQDFKILYQPVIDMSNGKFCCAEALSRWNFFEETLLPDEFIPVLENEGIVCELDFYVLHKVCQDIKKWESMGLEIPRISTNFSRLNIHNPNFGFEILEILEKYDVDHKYIEIEITENACYEDFDEIKAFTQRMKERNITVTLDDFGTGYSSLNILKNLPVNTIKLDKSFLDDMRFPTQESKEFFKNTISFIKSLNRQIICEGVEIEEEKSILLEAGCNLAQGFLYSKPLIASEFQEKYL